MSQVPSNKPKSPFVVNSTSSVGASSLNGTNFSIYGVGGYMEVYNVSDLYYTIPSGTIGQVYNSSNTIPINFYAGTGYSNNTLVLNSDNISSGRRKLGMLVYVHETDQIYQFKINNYDTLWSAATASTGTVVSTQYGTIVQGNSSENNSFINAWTGNTVEGISGATSSTAVWKKLATGGGGGSGITGGTYYPSTLTLDLESTGGTISIGNVTGLYVSAGTYTSGTSTLDLFNSTGGTISITGITAGSGSGGTSNFQYFISGSSPTGTINDGDRWFYTESGEEFVWVTDQNSSQWVQPVSISYGVSEEFVHITGDTMTGTLYVPTISATTYQNLPTDIRTTGGTYSNNTFTFTNNTGGTYSVLFNTVTGLTVNGNLTVTGNTSLRALTATSISSTGTTTLGNGAFTKAGFASGDVLLDNGGTDTPGVLMYYANNSNFAIDSYNGTFDVLSGQLFRIVNNLNEAGGAVKAAIDTSGNMSVVGFVKPGAWRAGQVINDIMLSNTEVTISTTTIATSGSDTDFLTYSYTPISSSSYLIIHYHLSEYAFNAGTGNDSYFSRIKVDGNEITYGAQSTVNGFRTGVLFPLTGRYTNSNTTAKSIVVACRRNSADDSITIANSSTSMWLRITEIGR